MVRRLRCNIDGRQGRAARFGLQALAAFLAIGLALPAEKVLAQDVAAPAATTALESPEPSEADRAALRYFAREGDTERLEAETRRLRALYPNWQPPRDLLAEQNEDAELQRVYDLIGQQNYAEARAAIAERRQRDPAYEPPARLMNLLATAEVRQKLRAASEAQNYPEVLRIAKANEQILTCEDVDSLWRIAKAFAATGEPNRAYDAFAYVIDTCTGQDGERIATLQKAAETLEPGLVTKLIDLGSTDAAGVNEFEKAGLEIVRGAVARGGSQEADVVPGEWLEKLADHARSSGDLDDAMLVGFYLYRHGSPADAAQWFRYALDNHYGPDAAEAYVISLRATGEREDQALAREVAYQWREQTPELMEAYLDAMATVLTADRLGGTTLDDVEQTAVDRYVPVVIAQRDPIGAQALGWYAFNTCQFIIAEEWFLSSANWAPTEAALYGLALARQRLGDAAGFAELVDEWGPLYPSVQALADDRARAPADPAIRSPDDPTDEKGVDATACDPAGQEQLRRRIVEQRRDDRSAADPIAITEAGSMSVAGRNAPHHAIGADDPDAPPPHFSLSPVQAVPQAQAPLPVPPTPVSPTPVSPAPILPTPVSPARAPTPAPPATATPTYTQPPRAAAPDASRSTRAATVTRRVRSGSSTAVTADRTAAAPVRRRTSGSSGRTVAGGQFAGCIFGTDSAARSGAISARAATARGYCFLELKRPAEAARAFEIARRKARYGSQDANEAAYGASLAAIALGQTNTASALAASAPLSRARRTELEVQILTQSAVTANERQNSVAAVQYLDQRNRIAPLQKDLMLLQGYAYRNAGRYQDAERMFRAVEQAGGTRAGGRAALLAYRYRHPSPNGSSWSLSDR